MWSAMSIFHNKAFDFSRGLFTWIFSISGIFSAKSGLSKLLKLGVSSSGVTVEDRLSEDN
jgi:hypothetical protein